MPNGRSKNDARVIEAAEKRRKALELRKRGKSYQEIADEVGWSNRSLACNNIRRELKDIPKEAAAELRELEMQRLDSLTNAVWPMAMGGDTRAIETVLKLMERRSRMVGLDSPYKVSHNTEEGMSMIGELMEAIRQSADQLEITDGTEAGDIGDDEGETSDE